MLAKFNLGFFVESTSFKIFQLCQAIENEILTWFLFDLTRQSWKWFFVESTSFIWPIYIAFRFKNVYNYTAFLENPSGDTQSFDIRRDVYPRLQKLPQKYRQVSIWRPRRIVRGYDFLSKWDQSSQECMLYLHLGYWDLLVIITIVFPC